jgi:hypothetical protein
MTQPKLSLLSHALVQTFDESAGSNRVGSVARLCVCLRALTARPPVGYEAGRVLLAADISLREY